MNKFGSYEGYIGTPCPICDRIRVEHYSNGFDICEKCGWCPQLNNYVFDYEFYDEDE